MRREQQGGMPAAGCHIQRVPAGPGLGDLQQAGEVRTAGVGLTGDVGFRELRVALLGPRPEVAQGYLLTLAASIPRNER